MGTPPADDLPPRSEGASAELPPAELSSAEPPPAEPARDREQRYDAERDPDSPPHRAELVSVRTAVLDRSTGQRLVAELARRPVVVAGASAVAALGTRALVGILARRAVRTLVAQQPALAQPTALVVNVVIVGTGHGE